jgi:hypothetical protein
MDAPSKGLVKEMQCIDSVAERVEPHCFDFGTKAETLWRLKPLINEALIPELYFFSSGEWAASKSNVLNTIHEHFDKKVLAIRSSALAEDDAKNSMAGAFLSKLNVDSSSPAELEAAIDQVVRSMTGNLRDQVLVQPMVDDVAVSGVIMTFDMVHGAPYYCRDFEEESGRTDLVTSGNGGHKSLFVYRYADSRMVKSSRVALFLRLARELEKICECAALNIEFGMNKWGQLFLFQVRRIALSRNWHPVTERLKAWPMLRILCAIAQGGGRECWVIELFSLLCRTGILLKSSAPLLVLWLHHCTES